VSNLNENQFGKACPQCGASMEKVEFTPKKTTSVTPRTRGGQSHGVNVNKKAVGAKEVWWQCPEDFGHTVQA